MGRNVMRRRHASLSGPSARQSQPRQQPLDITSIGHVLDDQSLAETTALLTDEKQVQHAYELLQSTSLFIYFVIERHRIFVRRHTGKSPPWTKDGVLRNFRFTNDFRVLDRGCQFGLTDVIHKGPSDFRSRVFRVLAFSLFVSQKTYSFLESRFGSPLLEENFDLDKWNEALDDYVADGNKVTTGAYQISAPTVDQVGDPIYHHRLIRLLALLLQSKVSEQIEDCRELCDLHSVLARFPSLTRFLGYQVALNLNMIPGLGLAEDWVIIGPGAQRGLQTIFGNGLPPRLHIVALKWLCENIRPLSVKAGYPEHDIPTLAPGYPALTPVDVEHILCEFHKYAKLVDHARYPCRGSQMPKHRNFPRLDSWPMVTARQPENKLPCHVAREQQNQQYTTPHPDDDGEYWPQHVLEEKGIGSGSHLLRVRWVGYPPNADTWESAQLLTQSSPDVVRAFRQRIDQLEALRLSLISKKAGDPA
ncbi:unnamed protein product [Peniophora sp. CBMAI 1063]|nr:unnamed protein product [Peniophora sp. CBMAI 1063]